MQHLFPRFISIFFCLSLLTAFPVLADESTEPEVPETSESFNSNPETKLAIEFGEFLGGEETSREVITALREGRYGQTEPTEPPPSDSETATTKNSSTGWGNVRITLKLAEARLAADGITQPTAEQLDGVLMGTDSDPNGILALRESGMGWGEISQQYGFKLGSVMGKGHQKMPVETTSGVTSAANQTPTNAGQAKKGGYIPSSKHAGQGLTTASGGATASLSAPDKSKGNAYGHSKITTSHGSGNQGMVSAAGAGSAGHANAATKSGKSNGKALGHSK